MNPLQSTRGAILIAAVSLAIQGGVAARGLQPVPAATATTVAIRGGTILTITGATIQNGTVIIRDGKITAVGANLAIPQGAQVVDATGKFVMPGIIDAHQHIALDSLETLRQRANAPKTAGQLEKSGVLFAFASAALKEPGDLIKNAARAVKDGLAPDAAVRALTINAARIAGVADRLGTLEVGKIANVIVTDGDLFGEKTLVKHVFIDGRRVKLDAPAAAASRTTGPPLVRP